MNGEGMAEWIKPKGDEREKGAKAREIKGGKASKALTVAADA